MSHRTFTHRPLNAWIKDVLGAAAGLGALTPLAVLANPTGGQVVGGSATITNPSANGTVINQTTQSAVINWQQFNIGSGQYVQFVQPSSSSVALNRVTSGNISQILGKLTANGQVFLVNPNGIFFGHGATLDVQGFVGSTLDINNSDFMAGHYVFRKGTGAPDAKIINQGAITTGHGGYVVLAGDYVENDGSLDAQSGRVVLAAGGQATLTLDQNQLVSYVVDEATLSQLAGVANTGQITANGGGVLMTADVANALTATAVNNSGFVAAHSAQDHGGVIVLTAKGGDIENSGTLDASATQTGVAGGTVILRGDGVTRLDPGSEIDAQGDGAKGGLVELSGHSLDVRGTVNPGRNGSLLIDPFSLSIVAGSSGPNANGSIGVGFIDAKLNAGVDVVLVASNAIGHASTVTALTATTGAGNLTIKTGSLSVGAGSLANISGAFGGCQVTGFCQPGTSIVFSPTSGSINLSGMNINIKGAFTADASKGNVNLSAVTAKGGITLTGAHITAGSLIAASGNVLITGTRQPTASTNITETGLIQGKNVTINEVFGSIASYGGSINVGNVTATAGSINIAATTTATLRMNIHTIDLNASKAVNVSQEGHSGGISFNNVTAGADASSVGVKMSTVLVGPSAGGGNITGGSINATGGVQIQANGNNGSGATVRVTNVTAQYISINATARHGADISTGILTATGAGTLSKDISLFAHANGTGANSHAYNGSSGGNIHVNGNITGNGKLDMNALGGVDSGGNIQVSGNINMNGRASMLAVNEGSFGGTVHVSGSITAKFVDITAQANWGGSSLRGANTNGAHIQIGGNVTATGTTPASSSNLGVNLRAGTASFANGNPSITVHGNVKAVNATVNLFVDGNHGGRSIAVHSAGSGWGSIKAQRVNIGVNGTGTGGSIDVGNITTLGAGGNGDLSIQAAGAGYTGHITVHGNVQVNGNDVFIRDFGQAVTVSGSINVLGTGGSVTLFDENSGSGGGQAAVNVGNVTASGRVTLFARGHGSAVTQINAGNLSASQLSFNASNFNGGNASISAGNLTAPQISVNARAQAGSGHAAHINVGSISAVSTAGSASVDIRAFGKADSVSFGKVTLSGHAVHNSCSGECGPALQPVGARFEVITHGGASDTITGNGNINVTAFTTTASNVAGDAVMKIAAYSGSASAAPVAAAPIVVNGKITVNAARDAHVQIQGSASGALSVKAGRNIDDTVPSSEGGFGVQPMLILTTSAVTLQAGNNINLGSGSITVGSGAAPGVTGDHGVTSFLGLGSINPNAVFIAGGALNLGTLSGTASYLQIRVGSIGTLGTVTLGSGAVVQLTATTNTTTLGVGNGAGQSQYTTADINKFSAYKVVIGNSALTGTMTVGTANLGSTSITLVDNGAIKSGGLLTAGKLNLLGGAGAVTLTADVASTDIVSGANIKVNDSAFAGAASLSINSTGVGSVSYNFGTATAGLANNVTITGALTLTAKGTLDLTSDSIHAGGNVALAAGQHILLGKTVVKAGGSFSADAHGSISNGGSAASITAAGATFKAATGNIVLDGETLNIGASRLAFSAAGSVSLNSTTIHAGAMRVAVAGNLNMTSATVHAASMQAVAGGSIDLSGDTVAVSGTVRLTAGFISANKALAADDIVLSGINLTAGVLEASAGGTIHNGGGTGIITVGALAVIAGHNINLSSTQINVGSGSINGVVGDPIAGQVLLNAGLGGTGAFPNATFIAGGSIQLAGLAYTGKTAGYRSYLYIQADNISITGTVSFNPGSLIQLTPFTLSNSIGIEDTAANSDNTIYLNQGLLNLFAGDTILIGGTGVSGNVDIGVNGGFALGPDAAGDPTNLIIDTNGTVTGLGLVTSTGLVTTLDALAGGEVPPVTSGEIDPTTNTVQGTTDTDDQKRQLLEQAITGNGPQGGTVTQDTGSGVCH